MSYHLSGRRGSGTNPFGDPPHVRRRGHMVEEAAFKVGRAACIILGGIVQQCHNGYVVEVGYLIGALTLIIVGFAVFLRPAN
jgi:hypothetical protein